MTPADPVAPRATFASLENDFLAHWASYFADAGGRFDDLLPAYRYGYDLRSDERYGERRWPEVESHARTGWESTRPGTWALHEDAIRFAWERASIAPTRPMYEGDSRF